MVRGVRGVASGIWEGAIPPGEILFELSTKNAGFYALYCDKLLVARNRDMGVNRPPEGLKKT